VRDESGERENRRGYKCASDQAAAPKLAEALTAQHALGDQAESPAAYENQSS
jgi:hypothetical protein